MQDAENKTARHTAGPWQIEFSKPMDITCNIHRVFDKDRFPTAFVPAWDAAKSGEMIYGTDEAKANARLIAAAPDLLDALKLAEGHLEEMRQDARWHPVAHCPVLDRVRRVIAQAEDKADV